MNPIKEKRILLGVTGSIAAFKAADLASKLTQDGAKVNVVLTRAAENFISPITFQSVTGEPAYTDEDLWGNQAHVLHVGLAQQAELLVIAPVTATTMAKLASGIADNLLSLTALACGTGQDTVPTILAPAMDAGMYQHAATQANIHLLQERGVTFIGPEEGHLASGLVAKGRMSEPAQILGEIRFLLSRQGPLADANVVVTAGGTQEALDPVRYLSNHSSGKQGYALAQAALDAGAIVHLVSAPTSLTPPVGAQLTWVQSAEEMAEATLSLSKSAEVLCMAAAVADFRPGIVNTNKIKKESAELNLPLETTRDILLEVKQMRQEIGSPKFVVGFAAETTNLIDNAQTKLKTKGLDMIAANDISAEGSGFGVDTNRVMLLFQDKEHEMLPLLSKYDVADRIISVIIQELGK